MGRKNKNARQVPHGRRIHANKYISDKYENDYYVNDNHVNDTYKNDKYMKRKAQDKRRTLEMKMAQEERRVINRMERKYGNADSNVSHLDQPKNPRRFEIWFACLGNHYGTSVQSGCRPVMIVSNDTANRFSRTVTVLPLTSRMKKMELPTHIRIDAESCDGFRDEEILDSVVLAEQVTTLDKSMLKDRMCQVNSAEKRKELVRALAVQLGMDAAETAADIMQTNAVQVDIPQPDSTQEDPQEDDPQEDNSQEDNPIQDRQIEEVNRDVS